MGGREEKREREKESERGLLGKDQNSKDQIHFHTIKSKKKKRLV
jgi:hypothetical protein